MAYMDVAATAEPNGRTVLLLHGKNFCAATWESATAALAGAGFRVVAVDQVGFCKSSKPRRYQFSFGRSEEHTSELQSLMRISYAVFCLKKKKKTHETTAPPNTTLDND